MTKAPIVFIDLGAYNGDTVELALKSFPGIQTVYAFEPLKRPYEEMLTKFKNNDFHFERAVADIQDGDGRIYIGSAYGDISSSTNVNNPNCDAENFEEITKFDFPRWFRKTIIQNGRSQHVILKLNIEGAEYPILSAMLDDGSISYVNEIYCDWHWYYIGMPEEQHHKIVKRLRGHGFPLCGGKPDELYNAVKTPNFWRYISQQKIFIQRSFKLLLKTKSPNLFRLAKSLKSASKR